jgi:poly(A) polymerase
MDRPFSDEAPTPTRDDDATPFSESVADDSDRADPRERPPTVVAAAGRIRRDALDPNAVFVVKHLQKMGHEAYLVGGCVRDLLLGLEPKDFDVATDASPQRIKRVFRSAFIIGRRFRLVHVRFPNNRVVETATFRADPGELGLHPDRSAGRAAGPIYDDNVFGTAREDAWRRDFSVNALFYDPVRDEVVDYVEGLADLETRTIRALGDPETRLREDPVRMIRALHFAARLGGELEPTLRAAIGACAEEIGKASKSRLYVELVKVLGRGAARPTMQGLFELGVLKGWLPDLVKFLERPIGWPVTGGGSHASARKGEPEDTPPSHLTWNLLGAGDAWGMAAHGVPESLMLAPLLGPWLLDTFEHGPRRGADVWSHVEETFRPLALAMNIPRRTSWELREILGMLDRLRHPPADRRRVETIVHRPIFPEALVYYELDLRARDHELAPLERWRALADALFERHQRGGRPALDDGPTDEGPPPFDDHAAPDGESLDEWTNERPIERQADGDSFDGPGSDGVPAESDDRTLNEQSRRRRGRRGGRGRGRDAAPTDDDATPPPERSGGLLGAFLDADAPDVSEPTPIPKPIAPREPVRALAPPTPPPAIASIAAPPRPAPAPALRPRPPDSGAAAFGAGLP